jgi:hypothetical protein
MESASKSFAADLSPAESRRWTGRLLIAVVLGAAFWNFVAAMTSALIVPGLARIMEADPQSPLYLGKGDLNFPALFTSILELCLALIVVLLVNSWALRRPKAARRKAPGVTPILSIAVPAAAAPRPAESQAARPVTAPAPVQTAEVAPVELAAPASALPAPAPKPVQSEKPAKPRQPKQIYYNSVGDPVDPDE